MKTISKAITVAVLSGFMVGAFADSSDSPFSCQEQTAKGLRTGLNTTPPFKCSTGHVLVQLVKGNSVAYCMGSQKAPVHAATAVCEKNPGNWAAYTNVRHICMGSGDECEVELY